MDEYFHAWNCVFMGLPKPYQQLLKHFPDIKSAWYKLSEKDLRYYRLHDDYVRNFNLFKKTGIPFKQFENFRHENIKALGKRNKFYPSCLLNIEPHFPPAILYVKGNIPSANKYFLGIVGTRDMTDYGQTVTKKLVNILDAEEFVVVSGLARGVDTNAHKAALENNIPTVAVLGYGLKRLPHYLSGITEQIITDGGAVISEYPPNLCGQKYHFPLRNRIISGLSKAVVVVEGGLKSGALITAKYALDQNREVIAVPGKIFDEKSKGPNSIIAKSEAQALKSPEEIYGLLSLERKKAPLKLGKFSTEAKLIIEQLKISCLSKNELMHKILIPAAKLSSTLTELELAEIIEKNQANKYFLKAC